jgi:arylsulfatase A-like enzyme
MLNRRTFCGALAALTAASAQNRTRPNIVYILADDLGWGDLTCYNPQSRITTPVLDGLAKAGVRFADMHSPSSVCTPTRYGTLTGRYCWRSPLKKGVLQGYAPNLIESGRETIASLLHRDGYQTACIGKWHLGLGSQPKADFHQQLKPSPNDHGFDYSFVLPASLDIPPYLYVENGRAVVPPTATTPDNGGPDPSGPFWRGGAISPGFQMDDVLPEFTRKSVAFIKKAATTPGQRPFFLYLPMTAPHTPWMPLKPFRGKSRAGEYGDFVLQVDHSVGQVLTALQEAGVADNTLVLFASDNGSRWLPKMISENRHRSNAHWRGMKADVYDGGHRVPFLARWPGRIKAGQVRNDLACLTDVLATVADVCGLPLRKDAAEDSFSLKPAMLGSTTASARDHVVHHSALGMFSIRRGNWKLNLGRGSGGFTVPITITPGPGEPVGELYDLAADPSETKNLYLEKPAIVRELAELLERVQREGRSRPARLPLGSKGDL